MREDMRNRGNGEVVQEALDFLERNYDQLWSRSARAAIDVRFLDYSDLFHETVMMITVDRRCKTIESDEEFRSYFRYRMRMVQFQTIKDYNEEQKNNADYQQAQKRAKEEDW